MKQIRNFSYLSIVSLFVIALFFSCNDGDNENENENDSLNVEQTLIADTIKLLWETPADFKTPESVKYDKDRDVLYIANINGNPTDQDENGFISKLSTSGEIIELEWVTGLSAPKGMGIFEDHLYVTDINRLVKISIDSGMIVADWPTDAEFLNDIDVDKNGTVFVTDMRSDRIFALINDTFDVWLQSDHFDRPNGLFVDNNNLLVGTNDTIYSVFIETKEINPFLEGTGGIDGLESVKNDQYVFSDWSGHIQLSSPGNDLKLILNTAKDTIQAADIEYSSMKDLILVPTFFHNTVSAYEVVRK